MKGVGDGREKKVRSCCRDAKAKVCPRRGRRGGRARSRLEGGGVLLSSFFRAPGLQGDSRRYFGIVRALWVSGIRTYAG